MNNLKQIFFILVITGFLQPVMAQNIKVEYRVKAKQSTDKPAFSEPFLLLINNQGKSLFISKNKLLSDKIFAQYYKKMTVGNAHEVKFSASDPALIAAGKYKNKYRIVIEKDFNKGKLKYQQNAFMSILQYTAPLPVLHWQITGRQKQLLGYKVQQAKLHYKGRDYTAWYAPAIAKSDGPFKFWGLPGLILEIADSKDDYHFIATGIEFPAQLSFPKKCFAEYSGFIPLIYTTEKKFKPDFEKTFSPENILGNSAIIGKNSEELKAARVQK